MNKQELIERLKLATYGDDNKSLSLKNALALADQLDEPQKVVVPRYIDSFIQYAKNEGMSLYIAMDNAQNPEENWIIQNEDLFARAWLDGYTIEQEKLYTVEVPNPHSALYGTITCLKRYNTGVALVKEAVKEWQGDNEWQEDKGFQLTEAEIRKDFEWAWQAGFAKEVE